jgi:hypothetical protein
MPVSLFFFFGVGRYIQTYILYGRFTNFAGLAMNSAFIVFMLGLVVDK